MLLSKTDIIQSYIVSFPESYVHNGRREKTAEKWDKIKWAASWWPPLTPLKLACNSLVYTQVKCRYSRALVSVCVLAKVPQRLYEVKATGTSTWIHIWKRNGCWKKWSCQFICWDDLTWFPPKMWQKNLPKRSPPFLWRSCVWMHLGTQSFWGVNEDLAPVNCIWSFWDSTYEEHFYISKGNEMINVSDAPWCRTMSSLRCSLLLKTWFPAVTCVFVRFLYCPVGGSDRV